MRLKKKQFTFLIFQDQRSENDVETLKTSKK